MTLTVARQMIGAEILKVRRNRSVIEDAVKDHSRRGPMEWVSPCRHLIEHNSQRKEVAAGIQRLATRLLRRHISNGPNRNSRAGIGAGRS